MIAYVAHVGCTEQRITNGVDENVGITVSEESEGMLNLYATEIKVASFYEFVYVVSHSDAERWDGLSRSCHVLYKGSLLVSLQRRRCLKYKQETPSVI